MGDRITVGEVNGDVEEINIRSTTVRSENNVTIIVPNADFVSSQVINWSHRDPKILIEINVGVSYQSDLDTVMRVLQEIAQENKKVLKSPKPEVHLVNFGESSWDMQLRIWIENLKKLRSIRSELNCSIVRKFRENNIEIPFPQRDLHVRTPLPLPLLQVENSK